MKLRCYVLLLFCICIPILFAGCFPDIETITKNPGNYVYGENEMIDIIDIDSGDVIGILKITGTEILKDEVFVIPNYVGSKENGEKVYEDIEYARLIQIYYTFDNEPNYSKNIGSDNFEREQTLSFIQSDHRTLVLIDEALSRIKAGTFGTCESCGITIPKVRLNALPYAADCIKCVEWNSQNQQKQNR